MEIKDYGKDPMIFDLDSLTKNNENYRTALWTGEHFQVTLMSIPTGGGDIGLEIHHDHDQFLHMVQGNGRVQIGYDKDNLTIEREVQTGDTVIVPAETWHNITNIGDNKMKVYSLYSPVKHPKGIIEKEK